jgi:hypothetical protein
MLGRKFVALWLVAALSALMLSATASAALTKPKLSFVKSGGATISWSSGQGSSPADPFANTQALRIQTFTAPGASAYTYGASEALVGIRGRTLAQINHLGFDSKGYLGNGAPRISLGTTGDDGDHTYFLSAFFCNDPLSGGSGGWRTSDFVHDTTDCTIFRDGTQMTWATAVAIAGANNEVVQSTPNDWFLIVDEFPARVFVDRLSVQNWMWVSSGSAGRINCNTGSCI